MTASTDLILIPDPRSGPVPVGWFEDVAMPALAEINTWRELDDVESQLVAVKSFVECYDGDALEFEKALRMLEKRRGDLAGPPEPGRRTDLQPVTRVLQVSPEIGETDKMTLSRWRIISRGWDKILPVILRATSRSEVTQAAVLRFIQGGVHFSSDSPEWHTPPEVVAKVVRVLGEIDVDPCADMNRTIPATTHYTKDEDGLSVEWGGRVYMNPPYGGEVRRWVDKLVLEYSSRVVVEAIALVPSRTDTGWFRALRDYPRCFVSGRLKFSGSENSAPFPSMVVYLGPNPDSFAEVFGDLGDIYELR